MCLALFLLYKYLCCRYCTFGRPRHRVFFFPPVFFFWDVRLAPHPGQRAKWHILGWFMMNYIGVVTYKRTLHWVLRPHPSPWPHAEGNAIWARIHMYETKSVLERIESSVRRASSIKCLSFSNFTLSRICLPLVFFSISMHFTAPPEISSALPYSSLVAFTVCFYGSY